MHLHAQHQARELRSHVYPSEAKGLQVSLNNQPTSARNRQNFDLSCEPLARNRNLSDFARRCWAIVCLSSWGCCACAEAPGMRRERGSVQGCSHSVCWNWKAQTLRTYGELKLTLNHPFLRIQSQNRRRRDPTPKQEEKGKFLQGSEKCFVSRDLV